MKNKDLIVTAFLCLVVLLSSCGSKNSQANKTGSQKMEEIKIGAQTWASKNLNVSTFRNGDQIPEVKTPEDWIKAGDNGTPAWCYFNNDPANGTKYGKLYNWHAVHDSRGLAPAGWHVPGRVEWYALIDYLGGKNVAGTKMKAKGGWNKDGNGTNESGFAGLPGGYRSNSDGSFLDIGKTGSYWSTQEDLVTRLWAYSYSLGYNYGNILQDGISKSNGLAVRCIRD